MVKVDAIVNDNHIPFCLLLGLDFMYLFNVNLNYSAMNLMIDNQLAFSFSLGGSVNSTESVLVVSTEAPTSHFLKMEAVNNEF